MSSSTARKSLLPISDSMVSMASRIGDAGPEEGAELAGEVHQLLAGHLLAGDLELEERLLLDDGLERQAPLEQGGADPGPVFGVEDAGGLGAVPGHGDVLELRHGCAALQLA